MARAERIGLAVAVVGHALLFGALSLGWLSAPEPPKPIQPPIDVSLVKDVALQSAAPVASPPAPSVAPEQGAPEDAAPPPEESEPEPAPKPAPPKPAPPKPVPPRPEPSPVPRPAPEKPAAKPKPEKPAPKPVPNPVPKPKPPEAKPEPAKTKPLKAKAEPKADAAPTPAKASPAKTASTKAAPAKPAATPTKAKPAAATGKGGDTAAKTTHPRGSRLGDDFLKGLADAPAKPPPVAAPPAAKIDAHALASIQAAIARQIQPCADRQSDGGIPQNARQIVITFNLRLNADGSLASVPRIVRRQNVDGDNGRYVQQIADIGIAAFKGCSPLRLPAEYYATAAGGWNNINFNWQLR